MHRNHWNHLFVGRLGNPARVHAINMPRLSLLLFSLLQLALLFPTPTNAQRGLSGEYATRSGRVLVLTDSGTYRYRSFECYHTVRSQGTWSLRSDTVFLHFDQQWAKSDPSLAGNTESLERRPLLMRGRRLYFIDPGPVRSKTYFKKRKSLE